VLYLPPIHPIGSAFKKGKNNSLNAGPDDPGSPWAIGSKDGGHKDINPDLGTLEDFRHLVRAAKEMGIEIALDAAFQCSPDHPYITEHPDWFKYRPDGTIQYAENPPKKYQDVVPFDWDAPDWRAMWDELKSVFLYWIDQGVKIFRVDNPHTKPFEFWEWCIREVRKIDPEAIFLAEAFTRLRVMNRLSQVGFTQSYTNFAWSHTKGDLTDYFTQLTTPPVVDYFRPNAWPNTPDILADYLREGHRSSFIARLVLAATLSPSYGIYGPVYELMEHAALGTGSEDDYANSEKYEVRHWDLDQPHSLRGVIAKINRARRENPALQTNPGLRFHDVDNDNLIAYSRNNHDRTNIVLCVVNMDPIGVQTGTLRFPLAGEAVMKELLSGKDYTWKGSEHVVSLDPALTPARVYRVSSPGASDEDLQ
jgi:starch synthase (maltosyl-transferring)